MNKIVKRWARGFSLVEVSLALLVAGLGLLAVFSLFPAGLTMNRRSIDETQSAMFANDVFDAYRSSFDADPTLWPLMGSPFNDDPGLGATAGSAWLNFGAGATVKVVAANAPFERTLYINWSNVTENAWRYRLTFEDFSANVKLARLQVLNGEYGLSNSMVEFYTEYYDFRGPDWP